MGMIRLEEVQARRGSDTQVMMVVASSSNTSEGSEKGREALPSPEEKDRRRDPAPRGEYERGSHNNNRQLEQIDVAQ